MMPLQVVGYHNVIFCIDIDLQKLQRKPRAAGIMLEQQYDIGTNYNIHAI